MGFSLWACVSGCVYASCALSFFSWFIIALYLPFFSKERERPHLSCRKLHDKHCVREHGGLRNWSSCIMVLPMSLLEVSMVKTRLQTGPWGKYQKLQAGSGQKALSGSCVRSAFGSVTPRRRGEENPALSSSEAATERLPPTDRVPSQLGMKDGKPHL